MKLRSLAIQGFRSFKKDEVFNFPETHGFFLLSGRNEVEPTLGANGAGKSSVWDALVWVLFGRTSRGLKAKAVANWEQQHLCSVCLEFEMDGEIHALTRTWSPNSLTLQVGVSAEPELITQDALEATLGFEFSAFMNTVLMGQFSSFFFDLTEAEKLQLFSEALDLQSWLKASDAARAKVKVAEANVHSMEVSHAALGSKVDTLLGVIESLKERRLAFEEQREENLKMLQAECETLVEMRARADRNLHDAEAEYASAQTSMGEVNRALLEQDDQVKQLQRLVWEAESTSKATAKEIQAFQKTLDRIVNLEGTCPTCLQRVTPGHVQRAHGQLKTSADELSERMGHENSIAAKAEKRRAEAQAVLDEVGKKYSRHESALRQASVKLSQCRSKAAQLKTDAERAQLKLENERKAEDPFTPQIEKSREERKEARAQRLKIGEDLKAEQLKLEQYKFWVGGFKDLRLWVIEQALTELEILVNNSLVALGLDGWQVQFDVERENTSGGVTKGFTALITSPLSQEPVPWEAWSGGETQRLRVAGAVGLASLIAARRGININLEVWDEPTAHLSQEGIDDLLKFFSDRVRVEGKQVWLVDHRSLSAGGFDDEFVVVKDRYGSHISHSRKDGHKESRVELQPA